MVKIISQHITQHAEVHLTQLARREEATKKKKKEKKNVKWKCNFLSARWGKLGIPDGCWEIKKSY